MFESVRPYVRGNILEVGSGIGNISEYLLKNGFSITLSDMNEFYIEELKRKFGSFSNLKDVSIIDLQHEQFAKAYPELEEKFDTVLMLNVLEHLADENASIRNARYVLKPGGRLIVLTPAYNALYSRLDKALGHHRRYTLNKLASLFQKNNILPEKKIYFNALGIVGWLYGKVLGLKYVPRKEMTIYDRLTPLAKMIDRIVLNKTGLSVIIIGVKE